MDYRGATAPKNVDWALYIILASLSWRDGVVTGYIMQQFYCGGIYQIIDRLKNNKKS